jgi:hypothetical protein
MRDAAMPQTATNRTAIAATPSLLRITGIAWHAKIPVVGFETLDTNSKDGRVDHAEMLFLLCILPCAALVHFWDVMLGAKIVSTATPPAVIDSIWHWTPFGEWNDPARIGTILRDGNDLACEGNITVVPGIEPMTFAGLTFLAVVSLIAFLAAVFTGKARSAHDKDAALRILKSPVGRARVRFGRPPLHQGEGAAAAMICSTSCPSILPRARSRAATSFKAPWCRVRTRLASSNAVASSWWTAERR